MLSIDDNGQEELFIILESNNSFDSLEDDFSSSSDSCNQFAIDSSDSPNIKIGCRDSCCNVIKSVNTLTKSEEDEKLIIQLINQTQNPESSGKTMLIQCLTPDAKVQVPKMIQWQDVKLPTNWLLEQESPPAKPVFDGLDLTHIQ